MESASVTNFVPKGSPIVIMVVVCLFGFFLAVGACWGVAVAEKSRHTGDTPNYAGIGGGGGDLSCPPGLNAAEVGECIDNALKDQMPSSPLIGFGKDFVTAGSRFGVNPAFLLAIGGNESSFGTNYHLNARGKANHNYQNMKCEAAQRFSPEVQCDGDWAKWASWTDSINDHAKYMRMNYFDKGQTTIDGIRAVYCPTSDCGRWTSTVTTYFEKFTSACPALSAVSSSVVTNAEGGVMLDPGHGGEDCDRGFIGSGTECGNNFTVATKVKAILEAKEIKVAMTKTSAAQNVPRERRAPMANASGAALFVSFHSNARAGSGAIIGIIDCPEVAESGGGIQYQNDSTCGKAAFLTQSKALSKNIVTRIKSQFSFGATRYWCTGELAVLHGLKMPGVLIEMFRHDNQGDIDKYLNKEDLMAQAIANGILVSLGKS